MALYQLMKVYKDGSIGQSGRTHSQLKRLVVRLSKMNKGWIQIVNSDTTKTVVKARGFSKQAMSAIKSCGVATC